MRRILLSATLFLMILPLARPQSPGTFQYAELNLKKQLAAIRAATDDSERVANSEKFTADLAAVLRLKGSSGWPFDSLKGITILAPPDKRFRLFTWPVTLSDGHLRYFGILQANAQKGDTARVIPLRDRFDSIADPAAASLSPANWYGAVYYQVIPAEIPGKGTVYTLLGWRGIDLLISSKVIEVLTFGPGGTVTFGSPVFCSKDKLADRRLIYKYSAKASMVLTYEKQAVVTDKKWNPSKKVFETERIHEKMIVLDRIIPMDPQMEGRYEYYIPASDVMDGLVLTNGCWTLVTGIDARNPSQKPKPPPRSPDK